MDRIIKQLLTFLCVLLAACFAAPSADAFGLEIRVGGSQVGTIDCAEQNDLGTRNLIRENGYLNYDTLSGCAVATKGGANYVNLLDDAAVRHVIKGDRWGSGGHAWFGSARSFFHGLTGKKSMFPITWSKRRILHEISDVATSPNMRLMNPNVVRRAGGLPSAAGVAEYGGSMRGVFAYVRGTRIHSGYPTGSRYYQMMRPVHRRWDRLPRWSKYGIGGGVGALGIWGGYELFTD